MKVHLVGGTLFNLANPYPEDVKILDIAIALGNICRFGGRCSFYSVAEHSVLVSKMVPEKYAMEALLHDASEAYFGDIVSPIKHSGHVDALLKYDANLQALIYKRYGVKSTLVSARMVHKADVAMCEREVSVLMHARQNFSEIRCLAPAEAARVFMARYYEILCEDLK